MVNARRQAEDYARSLPEVRWLRPDYQIARFGSAQQKAAKGELDLVAAVDGGRAFVPRRAA